MQLRDRLSIKGRVKLIATTGGHTKYIDVPNLVTRFGDQWYMERAVGINAHPDVYGMKLGTGTTTPSKTGAGSLIGTYLTGSIRPFDVRSPSSALQGEQRRIIYQCRYPAGVVTDSAITEVVLTTSDADSAGTDITTIARALFDSAINKAADTELVVVWYHDL